MIYIFMAQSCTGKSTVANKAKETIIYLITEREQLDKIIDIEGSCYGGII